LLFTALPVPASEPLSGTWKSPPSKLLGASGAIEETDKHSDKGKVLPTSKISAAPDGRTLTIVVHEHDGLVSTFIFDKQ
jgi:hypothetical protein